MVSSALFIPALLLVCFIQLAQSQRFPSNFKFGTASAAYQVEGGWNADGKGTSIWDEYVHEYPQGVVDGSNGDIAADTYHKYKEDVQLLKQLGVDYYRFSISWSRVLPNGDTSLINEPGLRYYDNMINELLRHGIDAMVTMYHWDMPKHLQDLGGMSNPAIVDHFVAFADILFARFGDRVRYWITFNEPHMFCNAINYVNTPPYMSGLIGANNYLCTHHTLQAHAKVYALYKRKYSYLCGLVGISLDSGFAYPKDPQSADDMAAANRAQQFNLGQYAHPIFSCPGDYPSIVRSIVDANSKAAGLKASRLPVFTTFERYQIRGSADFFGLNYYTSGVYTKSSHGIDSSDEQVASSFDPSWTTHASLFWLYSVPDGLRQILNWIRKEYNNPLVLITENGWSDYGELVDLNRIDYIKSHLNATLDAIADGCRVASHTTWSFLDDFEWKTGYTTPFGLYHVDFKSANRTRTAKSSVAYLNKVIRTRELH